MMMPSHIHIPPPQHSNNVRKMDGSSIPRTILLHEPKLQAISFPKGRVTAALLCFVLFSVSYTLIGISKILSSSVLSSDRSLLDDGAGDYLGERINCQIVYILGVEGSIHPGFTPMLQTFASQQVDPATGTPYKVLYSEGIFRKALFGFSKELWPLDHPTLVRRTLQQLCPNDGIKRVIIEDVSFPAGRVDDKRTYRVRRQPWWVESTMEEIALSETALNHPTNLHAFYKEYSPFADIKFVVLHRSFMETIASRYDVDGTVENHSNVIRGFMLLLRRFLDSHTNDELTGQGLWTLVCVEQMLSKSHGGDDEQTNFARRLILSYLADFLGWTQKECPNCFRKWKSSKDDHFEVLGKDDTAILVEHMRTMVGIWPPVLKDALPEQTCGL